MRRPFVGAERRGLRAPPIAGGIPTVLDLSSGSFSRAGAAWRVSDDGSFVQEYGANVVRSYVGTDGRRRYVMGDTVVQRISDDPEDISTGGGWSLNNASGSASLTDDVAAAPDGTTTASRLTFGANSADRVDGSAATPTGSTLNQISVFARTESGTEPFVIEADDGVTVHTSAGKTATTSWQRFDHSFTSSAVPTSGTFRIRNGDSSAGSILVWGADWQESVGRFLLPPVLAASATKNEDSLTFSSIASNPIFSAGCWFKLKPYFSSTEHSAEGLERYIIDIDTGSMYLRFQSNNRLRFFGDLGGILSNPLTWSRRQEVTIALDFAVLEMRLSGFTSGNGTTSLAVAGDWDGGSDVDMMNLVGVRPCWGEISDLYPISTSPI